MTTKAEHAAELHKRGCNCAQAVACTFCKEFGISEDDMFRIAEGFGLGMGVMEMCGALSGMAMIIGLDNSQGSTEEGSKTKGDTYKKIRSRKKWFLHLPGVKRCRDRKSSLQLSTVYRRCRSPDRRISGRAGKIKSGEKKCV